jgi:hypothetical protein
MICTLVLAFDVADQNVKRGRPSTQSRVSGTLYEALVSLCPQFANAKSFPRVEQNLVIIMVCIPPLRAVSKIQIPNLRSIGQSLVRIMGSTRSSRTKSSSKFHSSSESSKYQHLELGDSRKQLHKENTVLRGDKDSPSQGYTTRIEAWQIYARTKTFKDGCFYRVV